MKLGDYRSQTGGLNMIVRVTQEHIDNADMASCTNCMVALALVDAFPDSSVWVGITIAEIDGIKYNLPNHVSAKIRRKCMDHVVEPFEFSTEELELISWPS